MSEPNVIVMGLGNLLWADEGFGIRLAERLSQLCATPWTAANQASLSMGFSRQEHWNGLPFPSPIL